VSSKEELACANTPNNPPLTTRQSPKQTKPDAHQHVLSIIPARLASLIPVDASAVQSVDFLEIQVYIEP
jgi:hypothetical protein